MREFITSHTSDPAKILKNNSSVEDRAVNNGLQVFCGVPSRTAFRDFAVSAYYRVSWRV